jgi:hypothetical protein
MKANRYLVLDTECVGLTNKSVYDIAWRIVDKHNKVYVERSYVVEEIITNGKAMMDAFYAKKIFSHYIPNLYHRNITMMGWNNIRDLMIDDIDTYNANIFSAYNLGFDVSAIKYTNSLFNPNSKYLHKKLRLLDLWDLACSSILSQKQYIRVAIDSNWVSDKGNIQTSAEKAYAYITGNVDFIESHTALEDVIIESHILHQSLRQKKKVNYNVMNNSPWRKVAAARAAM